MLLPRPFGFCELVTRVLWRISLLPGGEPNECRLINIKNFQRVSLKNPPQILLVHSILKIAKTQRTVQELKLEEEWILFSLNYEINMQVEFFLK